MNLIVAVILMLVSLTGCRKAEEKKEVAPPSGKKTVCLNMIVKNESKVITRCLESMLPIIDYWVVVDTGSSDGTQDVIKNYMKEKGVPGELYERPWIDFSHNRNEALRLAKGKADYVFFIDADEYLVYDADFKMPELNKDYYWVTLRWPGSKWSKLQLVNNHLDWAYEGVLHEVICPPADRSCATLEKVSNIYTVDGARSSDPRKYEKDAQVLEAALQKEPNSSRYVFYLAKSYANAKNYPEAIKNYERRASMGPENDKEVYWSLLQIGILQEELGMPSDVVIESYKRACAAIRTRAEPYYHLAKYYRTIKDFNRGYTVASIGMTIPLPANDIFFVEEWIYNYGMLLEFSICAYWIDRFQECQLVSTAILKKTDLPQNVRECVEQNLGFANAKLLEQLVGTHNP